MGYEVHITRKDNWYDVDASKEITLEEWIAYIANDREMRFDNLSKTSFAASASLSKNSSSFKAIWLVDDPWAITYKPAKFEFKSGNITVFNPDADVLEKMNSIARALAARVLGQDGESYSEETVAEERKHWWKFWAR
ncbi:hypothetical protein [Foetidibacter luteolus]|uniref:hypothetical protein n=1 Tax=Foetidibacter luteolus TaxID=2608880 RepID=UPI00129B04BE|nr:hypothetical protein [Foetidibacter luteolus]